MISELPEDDLEKTNIDLTEKEEIDLLNSKPNLTGEELEELFKVEESKLSDNDFL